jgi:hypothetical protein
LLLAVVGTGKEREGLHALLWKRITIFTSSHILQILSILITPYCTVTMAIMTATPSASLAVHRDEQQIRSRLLQSLGIFPEAVTIAAVESSSLATSSVDEEDWSLSGLSLESKQQLTESQQQQQQQPLKYNLEEDEEHLKEGAQVSFLESVSVIEIPSHRDYSPEDRQDLWNSAQVIAALARRNSAEFSSEGGAWQNVLEEDAFVSLPSGELIHPFTFQKQQQDKENRRKLKLKKKQQRCYSYKSVASCLNLTPQKALPSSAKKSIKRRSSSSSSKRQSPPKPTTTILGILTQ